MTTNDFALIVLGAVIGIPITLIGEALIKGGFTRARARITRWLNTGPASVARHPVMLTREGIGTSLRLVNFSRLLYTNVSIYKYAPLENARSIERARLAPGESITFDCSEIGVSLEELDTPASVSSGIPYDSIGVSLDYANPSRLRRIFKRSYNYWEFTSPGEVPSSLPMQRAVLRDAELAYSGRPTTMPSEMISGIMALKDEDARDVLNAPKELGYPIPALKALLSRYSSI